jgi:hypothetical protein
VQKHILEAEAQTDVKYTRLCASIVLRHQPPVSRYEGNNQGANVERSGVNQKPAAKSIPPHKIGLSSSRAQLGEAVVVAGSGLILVWPFAMRLSVSSGAL